MHLLLQLIYFVNTVVKIIAARNEGTWLLEKF